MDDGEAAIYIDMEEILGVDFVFPMAYSNETEEAEVVGAIKQKLNKVPLQSFDCSICQVPVLMFNENPEAYIPHMVSIGPIHHDQKHLQPIGTHKMKYFKNFLSRSSPGKLKNYVKVVTDLAERASRCYPEVKIERKSLIMMMVVDGGFILELLHKRIDADYSDDEDCWFEYAMLDLILVENQLPFFVLEELYRVFIGNPDGAADTLTRLQDVICRSLVTWFLRALTGSDIYQTTNSANALHRIPPKGKPKHLLAFVRKFLVPSLPIESKQQEDMINDENKKQNLVVRATRCLLDRASACVLRLCIKHHDNPATGYQSAEPMRCATDLKNANVNFKKNKNPTSLLDINFDYAKGVLTIPPIVVEDCTEPILRNLMAYEFYSADYSYITEYIMFLNNLINSGKDVELLQESEIFFAILAQPNDVAKLFDSLNRYTLVDTRCTNRVNRKLMKYSNRRWNKWKASLMLNYFNTPWTLLSVVAAIILLVLTVTQTIFAILSYH